MLVGLGVDLLEVVARFFATSSSDMGLKCHCGRGRGSSGSKSGISFGTVGKNLSDRTWQRSVCNVVREPSGFRRGGILLAHRPCRQAVLFTVFNPMGKMLEVEDRGSDTDKAEGPTK